MNRCVALFALSCSVACQGLPQPQPLGAGARFELPEPGPMLPPVPAIVLGVQGDEGVRDDLTIVWTFVLNGDPPQIGPRQQEPPIDSSGGLQERGGRLRGGCGGDLFGEGHNKYGTRFVLGNAMWRCYAARLCGSAAK